MQKFNKNSEELPLFPLSVNVLPGGYLPLQIFEPRYLKMVSECLRQEQGFCVVLLQANRRLPEDKKLPDHYFIGTYVEIVDFNQLKNGLLGITVQGKYRIKVLDRRKRDNELIIGNVIELTEEEESVSLEPKYQHIWDTLREVSNHPEIKKLELNIDFKCSSSVVYNLASLLPLTPPERQQILECKSNTTKLNHLNQLVKRLGG